MEFLNIGPGELIFLVLLAILVVGPKRTVELMQQAGRLLARLQREWRTIQHDIMTEVRAVQSEVRSVESEVRSVHTEVGAVQREVALEAPPSRTPTTPEASADAAPAPLPEPDQGAGE